MERLVADFLKFLSTIAQEGGLAMSVLNFKIFLKFPHFLRSQMVSRSATRSAFVNPRFICYEQKLLKGCEWLWIVNNG